MIELDRAELVAPTPTGSVRVLHPTTLALTEPRIALIGANGSGKSTIARMLNGLVEPSAGSIRVTVAATAGAGEVAGPRPQPLDTVRDGAAVRRLVGFVFTDPSAQLVMPTVLEDVALSLRRHHPKKADRLDAARAALADFGLEQLADRSVHSLSGGQQQLLAIATVLATSPRVLVADEPTTLLDLRNSRRVAELLLNLSQQLIVATHDLDLAAQCDRVIVIAGGTVAHDSAAGGSPPSAVEWYREACS